MRLGERIRLRLFGLLASIAPIAAGGCIPDVEPDVLSAPRCEGVAPTCGPAANESCCPAGDVAGGTFNRLNDPNRPALVADFQLDRFEVTVGRFRQFVASYPIIRPKAGAGAHPLIEGSGWDPAWDQELPASQDELLASLECDQNFRTWTETPSINEAAPINCVSWYVAFAFCAWDGGRLPTDAEWNYAAAGGNNQRPYPWGDEAPSETLAVYGCETTQIVCPVPPVGSKSPQGDGKWGQADLAGSLFEWVFDYHVDPPVPCDNCAAMIPGEFGRSTRGGAFSHVDEALSTASTASRIGELPERRLSYLGFRCARDD